MKRGRAVRRKKWMIVSYSRDVRVVTSGAGRPRSGAESSRPTMSCFFHQQWAALFRHQQRAALLNLPAARRNWSPRSRVCFIHYYSTILDCIVHVTGSINCKLPFSKKHSHKNADHYKESCPRPHRQIAIAIDCHSQWPRCCHSLAAVWPLFLRIPIRIRTIQIFPLQLPLFTSVLCRTTIHMHYVLYCKSFNEKLAGVDPEQHKHYSYKYQGPSFRETNSDEYMSLVIIVRKGRNRKSKRRQSVPVFWEYFFLFIFIFGSHFHK
jgi:hypothetical protein